MDIRYAAIICAVVIVSGCSSTGDIILEGSNDEYPAISDFTGSSEFSDYYENSKSYFQETNSDVIKLNLIEADTGCQIDSFFGINQIQQGFAENGTVSVNKNDLDSEAIVCFYGKADECSPEIDGKWFEVCFQFNATDLEYDELDLVYEFDELGVYGRNTMNFITPEEVSNYLDHDYLQLQGNKLDDILSIRKFVFGKIPYRHDTIMKKVNDDWSYPIESFENSYGDCEDVAFAFLSLLLAYDESLDCYNAMLPGHVTTVCKLKGDEYTRVIVLDRDTEIRGSYENSDSDYDKYRRVNFIWESYRKSYYLNPNEAKVSYAFNNEDYKEFEDNEGFFYWLINN